MPAKPEGAWVPTVHCPIYPQFLWKTSSKPSLKAGFLQLGTLLEEIIFAIAAAHKKTATMGGHDAQQPLAFSMVV
jgi:hypothetical protein